MKLKLLIILIFLTSGLNAKNWHNNLYMGVQGGINSNNTNITQIINTEKAGHVFQGYLGYNFIEYLGVELSVAQNNDKQNTINHIPAKILGANLLKETSSLSNVALGLSLTPNFEFYRSNNLAHKVNALIGIEYSMYNYKYNEYSADYDATGEVVKGKESYITNSLKENENILYYNLGIGYELILDPKDKLLSFTANYVYSIPSATRQGNYNLEAENRFLVGIKLYF